MSFESSDFGYCVQYERLGVAEDGTYFDCLILSHPTKRITAVELDGQNLPGPFAGSTGFQVPSLWKIPTGRSQTLQIHYEAFDSVRGVDDLVLQSNRDGDTQARFHLTLSGGTDGFGLLVAPVFELVDLTPTADWNTISKQLLSQTLTITVPGAPAKQRPVRMLVTAVCNAIARFSQEVGERRADWYHRHEMDIPRDALINELSHPDSDLIHISRAGHSVLLDAFVAEGTAAEAEQCRIANAWGEPRRQDAIYAWQDAAPALIAARLTASDIVDSGLFGHCQTIPLDPLRLTDDVQVHLSTPVKGLSLDIKLPDGSVRPAAFGAVTVRNGDLVWAETGLRRAQQAFDHVVQSFGRPKQAPQTKPQAPLNLGQFTHRTSAPDNSVYSALKAAGMNIPPDVAQDTHVLAKAVPAPDWLAQAARPATDAFQGPKLRFHFKDSAFWGRQDLPDKVVAHALAILVDWRVPGNRATTPTRRHPVLDIVPDGSADITLRALDSELSRNSLYGDALASQCGPLNAEKGQIKLTFAPTDKGRLAQLLFSIGATGPDCAAFVEAMHGACLDECRDIALRRLGLKAMPRVVGQ